MSPEEIEECSITVDKTGRMRWDRTKAKPKEIEVEPFIKEKIAKILGELSQGGLLQEEHLSLYDKFVEG